MTKHQKERKKPYTKKLSLNLT